MADTKGGKTAPAEDYAALNREKIIMVALAALLLFVAIFSDKIKTLSFFGIQIIFDDQSADARSFILLFAYVAAFYTSLRWVLGIVSQWSALFSADITILEEAITKIPAALERIAENVDGVRIQGPLILNEFRGRAKSISEQYDDVKAVPDRLSELADLRHKKRKDPMMLYPRMDELNLAILNVIKAGEPELEQLRFVVQRLESLIDLANPSAGIRQQKFEVGRVIRRIRIWRWSWRTRTFLLDIAVPGAFVGLVIAAVTYTEYRNLVGAVPALLRDLF
jgi:hypothetical protein